jgi:hypothetical protein
MIEARALNYNLRCNMMIYASISHLNTNYRQKGGKKWFLTNNLSGYLAASKRGLKKNGPPGEGGLALKRDGAT